MQLGGMNSFLLTECERSIPLVSDKPTLIIGIDVSHGSPGQPNMPSIAAVWYLSLQHNYYKCAIVSSSSINSQSSVTFPALKLENPQPFIITFTQVVSSRDWPRISRYRAAVRTQSPKVEMVDSLFKPDFDKNGILRYVFCNGVVINIIAYFLFSIIFWLILLFHLKGSCLWTSTKQLQKGLNKS